MFELDLLNFLKGNQYLLRRGPALHLQVKVVGGDAADALPDVLASHRLDYEHHVAVSVAADHSEEPGELGLKKAPIEGKLAALKGGGGRQRLMGLFWLRVRDP